MEYEEKKGGKGGGDPTKMPRLGRLLQTQLSCMQIAVHFHTSTCVSVTNSGDINPFIREMGYEIVLKEVLSTFKPK